MHVVVALVLVFIVSWIVKQFLASSASTRNAPYPPGPKPKLFVGNMFDLPKPGADAAKTYVEWEKTYNSNIIHASALGNHIVVLNKREDAEELFERRSAKYSDRPSAPVVPMIGWQRNLAFIPYGNEWRELRKLCQQSLGKEVAHTYNPIQITKVYKMLQALLNSPEKFNDHIKMFAVSIPTALMYGYEVHSVDDPYIAAADRSASLGARLLAPGGSMINVLPLLRHIPAWFPGAYSHKLAAEVNWLTNEMIRIPTELIKRRMREGTLESPSMVSNFLEKKETVGVSEAEEYLVTNAAYTINLAAGDTTIAAIRTMFYALTIHPEVQRKAQAEIDRVIGPSRLPDFSDRSSLPYADAIYREFMRWRPPTPIGVPHMCREDEYYKGYYIPKGSAVYSNIWAMTHEEAVYPDPDTFNPERFLDEDGQLNDDDEILAYGFGRRICVGKHLASSTLWLLLVSILAVFDLRKAKDRYGNEIEINDEYEFYGLIQHKKDYPCNITTRSANSIALISDKVSH